MNKKTIILPPISSFYNESCISLGILLNTSRKQLLLITTYLLAFFIAKNIDIYLI